MNDKLNKVLQHIVDNWHSLEKTLECTSKWPSKYDWFDLYIPYLSGLEMTICVCDKNRIFYLALYGTDLGDDVLNNPLATELGKLVIQKHEALLKENAIKLKSKQEEALDRALYDLGIEEDNNEH